MQIIETLLPRENLSDALVALRNMILDGRLPGGERISEVYLAQRLGVSRTPCGKPSPISHLKGRSPAFPVASIREAPHHAGVLKSIRCALS